MASPMLQLGPLSIEPHRPYTPPRIRRQDVPAWMIGGRGFFDDKDKFWGPGECLYWDGTPNHDLIPINKLAYDKMQTWLDVMDELEEKKCKADKRMFVKKPRREWKETEFVDDLPMPDSVMGKKKDGVNEAIR